jgi:hypothetical protein
MSEENPQYALVCAAVAARQILYYMNGATIAIDGKQITGSTTIELFAIDEALTALGYSPHAHHRIDRQDIQRRLDAKRKTK